MVVLVGAFGLYFAQMSKTDGIARAAESFQVAATQYQDATADNDAAPLPGEEKEKKELTPTERKAKIEKAMRGFTASKGAHVESHLADVGSRRGR